MSDDEAPAVQIARLEEQVKGLTTLLSEREKQTTLAFASSEKAVMKAEEAQQRVNTSQNEFRGALKDQAGSFATKDEVFAVKETINALATRADLDRAIERVASLEKMSASNLGAAGNSTSLRVVQFQIVGTVISLATLVLLFFTLFRG